jgi:hypothetical protein
MSFIVASEESVLSNRPDSLAFGVKLLYSASDAVLGLMYGLGPNPSPETSDGVYRTFAFERFGEVPYTVRAIHLLFACGHYPESIALVRVLLESFVQLRYFAKYPNQLKPHLLATTAKGRIRWVTMFDEFAPGFYGKVYGLLSSVAHSGMGLSALLPAQPPTDNEAARALGRHGCEFDQKFAAVVINMTAAMLRGFLDHFFTFFPTGEPSEQSTFERRVSIGVLEKFVDVTMKGEMLSLFVSLTALAPTQERQS